MSSPNPVRWLKWIFDCNEFAWLPPLPPWAGGREKAVHRFRRTARAVLRRRHVADAGWGRVLAQSVLWPAMAGLKAWLDSRRPGRESDPKLRRRFLDLWWVQLAHNIRISDQHMLGFDRPETRALAGFCLQCREHQVLLDTINRNTGRPEMEDKRGFRRHCAQHGLPTVEVFLEGDGFKSVRRHFPPQGDLFLKPSDLGRGEGVSALAFDSSRGRWRGVDGSDLDTDGLADYATKIQAGHPWVLQPRLRNASVWSGFSQGGLCTVRVVTGRAAPDAPIEIVGGFMRFPRGDAIVDNLSAGGIAADFDLENGRLGPARDEDRPWLACEKHPDTAEPISGRTIPGWERIRTLALRAHEAIPHIAMIGWDIALPGPEPILVEMNLNWGLFVDTPLGCTRYIEIMGAWLEKTCLPG